jgi:hypothetical protein
MHDYGALHVTLAHTIQSVIMLLLMFQRCLATDTDEETDSHMIHLHALCTLHFNQSVAAAAIAVVRYRAQGLQEQCSLYSSIASFAETLHVMYRVCIDSTTAVVAHQKHSLHKHLCTTAAALRESTRCMHTQYK